MIASPISPAASSERSGRVGYPVPPGPSILEMMWAELIHQTGKLLELVEEGWGPDDSQRAAQTGHCLGSARMIAILLNPYNPNIEEVRAEVMRRIRMGDEQ